MSRYFVLHLLLSAILLIPGAFSFGAMDCHAGAFTRSWYNLNSADFHSELPGSFLLSDKSAPAEETSLQKPHIFRFSYQGPPYLLESERRNNLTARLWRDLVVQARAPFRFAYRHPARLGLVLFGVGAMVASDHKTLPWLVPKSELQENGLIRVGKSFSKYGETVYAVPIIVGFGVYGWSTHSPREKETFLMVTEALATSATWTGIMKVGFGRERPSQREAPMSDWTGPFGIFSHEPGRMGKQFNSFPSGHSSAIWSIATVLAHQYPKYYIVPILSYTLATGVAYSRMVVDAHWLSDIVVGGALGYLCARQVIRDNAEPAAPAGSLLKVFKVDFEPAQGYYGIRVQVEY